MKMCHMINKIRYLLAKDMINKVRYLLAKAMCSSKNPAFMNDCAPAEMAPVPFQRYKPREFAPSRWLTSYYLACSPAGFSLATWHGGD